MSEHQDTQNEDPTSPELLPLADYNKVARERYEADRREKNLPRLNGLACPDCGAELLDSQPLFQLSSSPPQKNVNCSKCKYVGYRVDGPSVGAFVKVDTRPGLADTQLAAGPPEKCFVDGPPSAEEGPRVPDEYADLPPLEPEAEVTFMTPLGMQVCVPDNWTDKQVVEFAGLSEICGTSGGWGIRKEGNALLAGDPERAPCKSHKGGPGREGFVHIMIDA